MPIPYPPQSGWQCSCVSSQDLVFDGYPITVEAWHHVHSLPLHQFIPIDGILADHVVEVAQMGFTVREGWSSVRDPGRCVASTMKLEVVELRRD